MIEISNKHVAEFRLGDPHAFNAIFDSFRMRIFYFVKKQINDSGAAEEITTDTFVKLYRLRSNFETIEKIKAFLFITSKNAALDFIKQRQRRYQHTAAFQQHGGPEFEIPMLLETDIEAEVLRYIYTAIENLPRRTKQVFKLFYLDGCTIATIANIMNLKYQTVANLKHAALNTLRMKILEKRPELFMAFVLLSSYYPTFRKLLSQSALESYFVSLTD